VQHLVSLADAALGVVEVATGALDLAAGAGLAGVVDDEGALGPRPQVVGLADAAGQLAGQAPPINILPAQEIVEHADLTGQNLAQLGAEAVEGFDLQQGPDQQGAEQVGQRLPVATALAADGGGEQASQGVALEAFGQFGIGEGEGLAQGVGQRGVGAGLAGSFPGAGWLAHR